MSNFWRDNKTQPNAAAAQSYGDVRNKEPVVQIQTPASE